MIVRTNYGSINGLETESAYVYLGVPFAAPPVGNLRFHAPVKPENWDDIRETVEFPPRALQAEQPDAFYVKEFYSMELPPISEDCLYLNIWVPKDKALDGGFPVAVWYHGGAYSAGFNSEIEFRGEAMAKKGVILVSAAYRLGMLGFFCHEKLDERDGNSGNYGMLDQIAALDWVRDNIGAFGGNADNITIFGQSAGGMSILSLISSPLVKGKIAHAIIQSGGGYKSGFLSVGANKKKLEKVCAEYLKKKKISFEQLLTMPVDEIVALQADIGKFSLLHGGPILPMQPIVDGYALTDSVDGAIKTGMTPDIPYLIGCNKNDTSIKDRGRDKNKFFKPVKRFANIQTAQGKKIYTYYFKREMPGDDAGAFHSAELWYVFGTLKSCWRPLTEADCHLSEKMINAWTDFMKTGCPGWEPYENGCDNTMEWDIE